MDITSLAVIRSLCQKYGFRPQKERGQNFLISREVLDKIISAADLKKDDTVLEIGPGFGALTLELAKRAKKVAAVEADKRLANALRELLKGYKNVEIINEDVLKITGYALRVTRYGYKIVANLPYQITSAVLRKFLENEPRPSEMIVMVQKEVAERICAKPRFRRAGLGGQANGMSLLSVSVQFFGRPEIVEAVPKTAFWPEPKVDSAILKISNIKHETETNIRRVETKKFFQIVKTGFSARRKQLHNNLSGGLRLPDGEVQKILIESNFDPKARAQDLGVDDWIRLVQAINCPIA